MVRVLRWVLSTVAVFVALGSLALVVLRSEQSFEAELHASALRLVESLEDRFFRQQTRELAWLSLQPEVREFLETGKGDIDRVLAASAGILDHDMVYLFNRDGIITASSRPETVGTDVAFRPYVDLALKGETSFSVAKGVTTKARGIYVVMPVYSRALIQGGVAFRLSARRLDEHLKDRGHSLLVTAEDVVFSSSHPQEFLRTLRPLSAETLLRVDSSRQFPGVTLLPLGWTWKSPHLVSIDGQDFRVEEVPLESLTEGRILVLGAVSIPWTPLAMTLVGWLVMLGVYLLVARQIRLVRERQQVEVERRHGAELLEATLEGMALIDVGGSLVWTNPEFLRVLGVPKPVGELPTLAHLWDPGTPPGIQAVLQGEALRATGEAVIRGLQGAWVPVAFGFSRFGSDYLLGVLDLSEHVRSEALIHQSQRLSALGQLAGGVAHDLNNILGVLIGMTDILKDTVSTDHPERESLDLMSVTLTRATGLAEKLLNFARQSPVERKPVDLGTLVRELKFLAEMTLPPNIEALFEFPSLRFRVLGDVGLLQSALLNLVVNAADAMEHGGRLRVSVGAGGMGQALIVVEDNGPGMPPEVLRRVFEPFFTTKAPKKGTGLGLSLVRRTVQEHRGTIDIQSVVGQGTTVSIQLPLIADPAPE